MPHLQFKNHNTANKDIYFCCLVFFHPFTISSAMIVFVFLGLLRDDLVLKYSEYTQGHSIFIKLHASIQRNVLFNERKVLFESLR